MTVIAWIAKSWLGKLLFDLLFKRLAEYLKELNARRAKEKQIDEDAKQSVDPLKKAQTADEIDKAADDALNGF